MKNYIFKPKTRFFIRFLKESGVYSAYKNELCLQKHKVSDSYFNKRYKGNIKKLFDDLDPEQYIDFSLIWKETTQGEDFWRELEKKFLKYTFDNYDEWFYKNG